MSACKGHIRQIKGNADDPLGLALVAGEELEQILELAGILLLQEALSTSRLARVPTELGTASAKFSLFSRHKSIPSPVDEWLMQETVDDPRVHPLGLAQARLEVPGHMFNVSLARRVKGRAEATSPVLALAEELDHLFCVGTRLAAVALLVVLVERVGAPETAVAAWLGAGILSPTLVELILVTLPVILSLEAGLA